MGRVGKDDQVSAAMRGPLHNLEITLEERMKAVAHSRGSRTVWSLVTDGRGRRIPTRTPMEAGWPAPTAR